MGDGEPDDDDEQRAPHDDDVEAADDPQVDVLRPRQRHGAREREAGAVHADLYSPRASAGQQDVPGVVERAALGVPVGEADDDRAADAAGEERVADGDTGREEQGAHLRPAGSARA